MSAHTPDLPPLRNISSTAAIRFDPGLGPLVVALQQAEHQSMTKYLDMSSAEFARASRSDCANIARETIEAYKYASFP